MQINTTYNLDALAAARLLPDGCVDCIVTSPPYYGLRDYGVDGQIGQEESPEAFIAHLVTVFRELWRVLKPEGTLWVNMGDSYAGSNRGADDVKPKDLIGIRGCWRSPYVLMAGTCVRTLFGTSRTRCPRA